MNSSDTRIETYLNDLARMLPDLDPAERDDMLAGIREHLDAARTERPDDPRALYAVLLRLGPPEQVAAAAREGAAPSPDIPDTAPPPPRATPPPPSLARVAVVTTLLSTVPFLLLAVWTRASSAGPVKGPGWPDSVGLLGVNGAEVALLMVLTSPLWVIALVCTLIAPTLSHRTRLRLSLLGPASFVVVVLTANWSWPTPLSSIVAVLVVVTTLWQAAVITRHAWRE